MLPHELTDGDPAAPLPRRIDDAPEDSMPETAEARVEPSEPAARKRVLVVEDNEVNQRATTFVLQKSGYECEVAWNGIECLERLDRGERFDLVLMDCQMPEMDGLEATRRIRERERATGEHLPIVAMTARSLPGDREECLGAGMDDYLAKPFRPNELLEVVKRWLRAPAQQ